MDPRTHFWAHLCFCIVGSYASLSVCLWLDHNSDWTKSTRPKFWLDKNYCSNQNKQVEMSRKLQVCDPFAGELTSTSSCIFSWFAALGILSYFLSPPTTKQVVMPTQGDNRPVAPGFAAVQQLRFTALDCNGWADSLSNPVKAFASKTQGILSGHVNGNPGNYSHQKIIYLYICEHFLD